MDPKAPTPTPTPTVRFQNHHPTTTTTTTTITIKKQPSQKNTTPDPPLLFHSPHHRSDSAENTVASTYASPAGSPALLPPPDNNSKAIVSIDKYAAYAPRRSPLNRNQRSPENDVRSAAGGNGTREAMSKPVFGGRGGGGGGEQEEERSSSPVTTILRRSKSREMTEKAALGFRVTEVIVCLISFSVMAADKTQGWSGDSFDRYREYRFCLSVNIIGFVYAAFQACNLTCHLVTEKHIFNHHLRCYFDFLMDQILAYLLISASSAAATRVIDWESNWGKDEFTEMASGSIATSFLAFLAFAISSLISGYNLCTRDFA